MSLVSLSGDNLVLLVWYVYLPNRFVKNKVLTLKLSTQPYSGLADYWHYLEQFLFRKLYFFSKFEESISSKCLTSTAFLNSG